VARGKRRGRLLVGEAVRHAHRLAVRHAGLLGVAAAREQRHHPLPDCEAGGAGGLFSCQGDALVGFSVHGGSGAGDAGPWSQNLVRAMKAAKDGGAHVLSFSGFDGGAMAEMSDFCLTVPIFTEDLGTPLVESIHVLLHHVIVHTLRERIRLE